MSLTRQIFSSKIDNVLTRLHIGPSQYNTHSFRIGAATPVAQTHIADSHIKTLGRWKSDAFQSYVYKDASTGAGWTILSACFSQSTYLNCTQRNPPSPSRQELLVLMSNYLPLRNFHFTYIMDNYLVASSHFAVQFIRHVILSYVCTYIRT